MAQLLCSAHGVQSQQFLPLPQQVLPPQPGGFQELFVVLLIEGYHHYYRQSGSGVLLAWGRNRCQNWMYDESVEEMRCPSAPRVVVVDRVEVDTEEA
jgi:hypothetical protein